MRVRSIWSSNTTHSLQNEHVPDLKQPYLPNESYSSLSYVYLAIIFRCQVSIVEKYVSLRYQMSRAPDLNNLFYQMNESFSRLNYMYLTIIHICQVNISEQYVSLRYQMNRVPGLNNFLCQISRSQDQATCTCSSQYYT